MCVCVYVCSVTPRLRCNGRHVLCCEQRPEGSMWTAGGTEAAAAAELAAASMALSSLLSKRLSLLMSDTLCCTGMR